MRLDAHALVAQPWKALISQPWQALADQLPPRATSTISYSRKVFIPLTRLCQDSCGYCTFAAHGGVADASGAFLTPDEVLQIARQGREAGCTEALFTLGDRPEHRWPAAREALAQLGHDSTISYLAAVAARVLEETGLLPHTNPGVLSAHEMARLREVSVSQGLMLETLADTASAAGGPHAGCRTKLPLTRLRQLELAGRLRVPFTTGLLLGLGETRADTIDALLRVRRAHKRWGHVQVRVRQPGGRLSEASGDAGPVVLLSCSSGSPAALRYLGEGLGWALSSPLSPRGSDPVACAGTHPAALPAQAGHADGGGGSLPRGRAALGNRRGQARPGPRRHPHSVAAQPERAPGHDQPPAAVRRRRLGRRLARDARSRQP